MIFFGHEKTSISLQWTSALPHTLTGCLFLLIIIVHYPNDRQEMTFTNTRGIHFRITLQVQTCSSQTEQRDIFVRTVELVENCFQYVRKDAKTDVRLVEYGTKYHRVCAPIGPVLCDSPDVDLPHGESRPVWRFFLFGHLSVFIVVLFDFIFLAPLYWKLKTFTSCWEFYWREWKYGHVSRK